MILDTSAVVAAISEEEGAKELLEKMGSAPSLAMGTATLVEASVVLIGRHGTSGQDALSRFVTERDVSIVRFDSKHWKAAATAYSEFGKGRHPARLNLGDCMSYATAKVAGEPLLFTGNDFARTDIAPA